MKRVVRLETSVCFRITSLMNNHIKSSQKATCQKEEKATTRMLWLLSKSVSQLGCVSQDSDALVSQGTKSRGNPMHKVLEPSQRVRFTKSTLREASIWEKKGPSLGKINVKVPYQRSPYATKFEDRSHEETERQQRCARSKAWNLAKKHSQAQGKRQGCILVSRGGMGTPGCVNKKSRRKESLLLIQERVCIW